MKTAYIITDDKELYKELEEEVKLSYPSIKVTQLINNFNFPKSNLSDIIECEILRTEENNLSSSDIIIFDMNFKSTVMLYILLGMSLSYGVEFWNNSVVLINSKVNIRENINSRYSNLVSTLDFRSFDKNSSLKVKEPSTIEEAVDLLTSTELTNVYFDLDHNSNVQNLMLGYLYSKRDTCIYLESSKEFPILSKMGKFKLK